MWSINLSILFFWIQSFSNLLVYSKKCPSVFPKMTSSNVLFCPMNQSESKVQRYSIYSDIKKRKAANPHICKVKMSKYLAFLLNKSLKQSTIKIADNNSSFLTS